MSLTDYEMLQNEVVEQQLEIAELKTALQQNDDEIKNSEAVRASIGALTAAKINGLINENNELKQEINNQKRQLDDKVKLIKLTDKANSAMSLEISDLKARQVVVAAYAEQRINMLNKANESLKAALHLAVTKPMQPLISHRFKENKIVRHCLDAGGTDLNKLAMMDFSVEDREQFAQLIGYSLGGYSELSYVTDESYYRAEKQCEDK